MKIVEKFKSNKAFVKDVACGSVFRYEGELFIRIEKSGMISDLYSGSILVVNFHNNRLMNFGEPCTEVEVVNATISVE